MATTTTATATMTASGALGGVRRLRRNRTGRAFGTVPRYLRVGTVSPIPEDGAAEPRDNDGGLLGVGVGGGGGGPRGWVGPEVAPPPPLGRTLASMGELRDARPPRRPSDRPAEGGGGELPPGSTRSILLPRLGRRSGDGASPSDAYRADAASLLPGGGGSSSSSAVSAGSAFSGVPGFSSGVTTAIRKLRPPGCGRSDPYRSADGELTRRRRAADFLGKILALTCAAVVIASASSLMAPPRAPPPSQSRETSSSDYYSGGRSSSSGPRTETGGRAGVRSTSTVGAGGGGYGRVRGGMARGGGANRYAGSGEAAAAPNAAAAALSSWEREAVRSAGGAASLSSDDTVAADAAGDAGGSPRRTETRPAAAGGGAGSAPMVTEAEVEIPPALSSLSDLSAPYDPDTELPYFWDVHFSGESVAERYFSKCHGLVQAAEHGLRQPDFDEGGLAVFELRGHRYVNVDMSTRGGIERAKRLGLASAAVGAAEGGAGSGPGAPLADVVVSPVLHSAASVFGSGPPAPSSSSSSPPPRRGRAFALFRHPVDRAVSMYYYLSTASWDPMYNPRLADMSLSEYARSGSIERNWVTRFLVDKPRGSLKRSDLALAKRIVKRKMLVGLYEDLDTSLARFQRYFGWDGDHDPTNDTEGERKNIRDCRGAVVEAGDKRHRHPTVEEGSEEWKLIAERNRYDVELYEYAKRLYGVQAKQIFGVV